MNKLRRLKEILTNLESVVVAFSGGVDSSFLLKVARDTLPKDNILPVTAVSDTYPRSELNQAKRFVRSLGLKHKIIFTDELKDKEFVKNPVDRCYFCKKELFKKLTDIAKKKKFMSIVDGSNSDDKMDYRPGNKAKKEFGVKSPLQEARITKSDVRRLSKRLGLKTWDLSSMACLSSRIPYGERICKSTLIKIDRAEQFIKRAGIKQVRVRYHNDIARIEVGEKDIKRFFNERFRGKITRCLKSLGFCYIVLDLEGYRTGSMNEVLKKAVRIS